MSLECLNPDDVVITFPRQARVTTLLAPGFYETEQSGSGYTTILPDAHSAEMQAINDLSHPAFADYPDAIDVLMKARDLLMKDIGARYEGSARIRTLTNYM